MSIFRPVSLIHIRTSSLLCFDPTHFRLISQWLYCNRSFKIRLEISFSELNNVQRNPHPTSSPQNDKRMCLFIFSTLLQNGYIRMVNVAFEHKICVSRVINNTPPIMLTHWGRVTHICVSKLTIIGSDNGLSPGRRKAIIWTNADIVNWTLGNKPQRNLNRNLCIFIKKKCIWKCRLGNGDHLVSASVC